MHSNLSVKPLRSQSSGHSLVLQSDGLIFKPLEQKELEFYANAPHLLPELVDFIPTFHGVVQMRHQLTDEEKKSALATLNEERLSKETTR